MWRFPLGCLTCVTGPSGSGKSSLVVDTLYKHMALSRGIKVDLPGVIDGIDRAGPHREDRLHRPDPHRAHTPAPTRPPTPRSSTRSATIFASTADAKKRGYKPGRFSFNVRGGRCEACQGDGVITVEMHFLPDIHVTCEVCGGKRYNRETLEVRHKWAEHSRSAGPARAPTPDDCSRTIPPLARRLEILEQVGLGIYPARPARHHALRRRGAAHQNIARAGASAACPGTLYILDEPTTGLHMHEVGKLIQVLHQLVDTGATVVVIEHNTAVILSSDYVIDLGPGGGEYGGRIVSQGTPEEIMADPESITGRFLTP